MDIDIPFTLAQFQGKGLTQVQIGTAIGCGQSVVSEMASGKCGTTRPSYHIVNGIMKLAAELGVPTSPPPKKAGRKRHAAAS